MELLQAHEVDVPALDEPEAEEAAPPTPPEQDGKRMKAGDSKTKTKPAEREPGEEG